MPVPLQVAGIWLALLASCASGPQVTTRAAPIPPVVPPPPAPATVAPQKPAAPIEPLAAAETLGLDALAAPVADLPPLSPPPLDPAARQRWLKENLDLLFGGVGQDPHGLPGATVSVLVVDHARGRMVYQKEPRASLNAASNVKLLSMAAALSALGPEYRFQTALYGPERSGRQYLKPGGELDSDLYLKAGGDPTLAQADLEGLADQLYAQGVRKIGGGLVVDNSFFDAQSMPPAFDQKDESGSFRSPSSAASLTENAVSVTIMPGAQPGMPARVTISPASSYVQVKGRVVTAGAAPAWPRAETSDGGDHTVVELSGRISQDSGPVTLRRRIVHPELFLGQTFIEVLRSRQIAVVKPLRVAAAPEGLRRLASRFSESLAVITRRLGKDSDNFTAEQILRALGAESLNPPGTWDKGLQAVGQYMDKLGIPREEYRLENASGLYDSNRFSAEHMVKVLRAAMLDFRIGSEFLAALSLAGSDGTLAHRMTGTPAERYLRAKTGTLQGTSCLSGVVGAPGQVPLVFSILMNQVSDTMRARAIQDQAGAALAWYLDPSRGIAPEPVAGPATATGTSPTPAPPATKPGP